MNVPLALLATVALAMLAGCSTPGHATVHTADVDYAHGDANLRGYVAWDDRFTGPRPGVVIVHQWMGLGDYEKMRARQLAEMGYVAFALDMYGVDARPADRGEAGKLSGKYKGDRALMRSRAQAGLDALLAQKHVDKDSVGAIGYCFGGTVVLEMARAGQPIDAAVSFHGGLETPTPAKKGEVKARVLVCHGGDDANVSPESVLGLWKEMKDAGVDYRVVVYSDAVHGFTEPGRDAYNPEADRDSWAEMNDLFTDLWGARPTPDVEATEKN